LLVPKTLVGAEVLPESADTVNVKQQDDSELWWWEMYRKQVQKMVFLVDSMAIGVVTIPGKRQFAFCKRA
jgi:hypothetical protein